MKSIKVKFYQNFPKVLLLFANLYFFIQGQNNNSIITQNFVSNGDFSQNNCNLFRCISSDNNMVKDWIPDPELEIGYASAFTDHFEYRTQRIIELTPNKDSCIKQQISALQPGYYKLTIESVARRDFPLSSGQYTVSLNGSWLRTVTPTDYRPRFETFDVEVKNICGAELKLCGIGKGIRKDGAVIKSVKMVLSSLAQQQYGSLPVLFCKFEPTQSGIFIYSHSNDFFQKQYLFEYDSYEMSFDYKIIASAFVTASQMIIKLDGLQIYRFPSSKNGTNIMIPLQNITKGWHTVSFHSSASSDDPDHSNQISNLVLQTPVCLSKWSQNLIVNGGFQDTTCASTSFCFYNKNNFVQSNLPGWVPDPYLQVGIGNTYNPRFTTTKIIESDAYCFKQFLTLKAGKYILKFDRAARINKDLATQSYEIKLNNQVIKKDTLTNYEIYTETVQFFLTSVPILSQLKICGLNFGQVFGVIFDNFQLIHLDTCYETKNFESSYFSSNIIEVGRTTSNITLNNGSNVIQIGPDSKQCSSIKYNLLGGDVEIVFDFQAVSEINGTYSALIVYFDRKIIQNIPVTQSGNQKTLKIPNVLNGFHTLQFCPFQHSKEQLQTFLVSNLVVKETQYLPKWTQNLIINGDFEQALCAENACLYNQNNWHQDVLPGWINSIDEVQVGKGINFNPKIGDTKIVNLDVDRNTCIRQNLLLKAGNYFLSFVAAAQNSSPLSSNGLQVKLNGKILKKVTHNNYDTTFQKIFFTLECVEPGGDFLQFCGTGLGDSLGSLIDDVKLFYYDEHFNEDIFYHQL